MNSISKEMLIAHLENLRRGSEKLKHDMSATDGAIQECEYWIAKLDEEEKKEE